MVIGYFLADTCIWIGTLEECSVNKLTLFLCFLLKFAGDADMC